MSIAGSYARRWTTLAGAGDSRVGEQDHGHVVVGG